MEQFLREYMHYHIGTNMILFSLAIVFLIEIKRNTKIERNENMKRQLTELFLNISAIFFFLFFIQLDLFQWHRLSMYGLWYYFLFSVILLFIIILGYIKK